MAIMRSSKTVILLVFILFVCLVVAGCGVLGSEPEPTEAVTPTPTPVPTPFAQGLAWVGWEESAHADTYALEKGPNTYCARCHSPENWDPGAAIDPPPNCVSCKFAFEGEPRQAAGNPLVPEVEWQSIGCEICHAVDEHGIIDPAPSWYDPQTGFHEDVSSNTDLCGHCHRDTETLRHTRDLGEGAHATFDCTTCHNPHDLLTSCSGAGCHTDLIIPLPPILPEHQDQVAESLCKTCHASVRDIHMNFLEETPVFCMECHAYLMGEGPPEPLRSGHGAQHAQVMCVACHDGSGLEVGPLEEYGLWMTFRTTELLGRMNTEPYMSHTISREVDCARCHFADNPWSLPEEVDFEAAEEAID